MSLLQATQLTKSYPMGELTVHALRGVDFCVEAGEFVAIMGPSGSGKSTLLHLLGGLDSLTSGTITLAGKVLSQLSEEQLTLLRRRQIGFVFQFFNLLPTLTAAENVALPLLIDGKFKDAHQAKVDELLELVGLGERKSHRPHQLSGGQQQRVAIARALVTNPAVVLADEPTGNLDSTASLEILHLLRRACDEKGQTIVLVTHDLQASGFADRTVHLRDGMVETASMDAG